MALSDMSAPSEVPRSPGKLGDGARLQLIIGEVERLNRIKERKRKKDKKKASKAKRWAPVTALVESKGTASQSPFQADTEGKKHKSTKKKKRRDSQDQPYAAPSLSAPFPLDNSNPEEGHSPKKKKKKKNKSAASSGASQEDPSVASETPISSPESLQVSQSAKKKKKRKRMKDSEQDAEALRDERTSAPGSPPYHLLNPGPSEIQMSSAQSPKKDKKRKSRKLFVLEEPFNRTLTEDSEAEKRKSPKKKKKKRDKGENSPAITAPPGEQELAESELAVQSGSFVYPGLSDVPMSSTEGKERSTKQKKRKKRKRKHSETQENPNPQDETLSQSIIPPFLPPSSPPTAKKAKTTGSPVAATKDSTPKKDWFGRVKGTKKVNSSSASAQEQHQQVRKVPQHRVRAEFSPTHEGDVSRPLFSEDFWDDLDQAVDNNGEGGGKDREKKKKVKKKSAASAPTLDLDPSSSFEIRAPPSTAPSAEEGAGEEGGLRGLESPAEQARPAEGVEDAEPSEESDREALVSESAAASPPRGARRAAKTPELLSGLSLHRHVTAEDEKKRREVEEKKRRLRKRMVFRTVEEEQEEEENQESEEDLANQAKISSPIRFVALNKDSDEDSTTPDRDTPPPARDSQDSARNNEAAEIERSGSDEENVSSDATSASSPSKKTGDKSSKTSPRKSPRKEPPPVSPPAQLVAQVIPQPPSSPKRKPPRPSLLFSPAACSTRNNTLLPPGTPPPPQKRSSPRKKTPEKSAVPPEVAPVTSERSPGKASPRRPSPPGAAPGTKRSPSRSPEKRNDKTTGAEATPSPKRGSKVSSPPPARKRRNGSPIPPARSPPEKARYVDEDEEESDGEQAQHPPTVASSRPEEEEEDEAEGSEHEEGGEEEGSSPEEGEGEAVVSGNGESPALREVEGGEQNRGEEEEEDVRHDRERNRKLLEMTEIEILEGNPRMRSRAELEEEDVRVREEIEGAAVAAKEKKEEARRKRLSGIDDEAEAGGVRASQHEQQRPRQLVDSLMSAKIPRPQFLPGDNRHLKKAISWILDGNDFPLPELQFSFRSTFGAPSRAEQRRVKRDIPHYTPGKFDHFEDAVLMQRLRLLFAGAEIKKKEGWKLIRSLTKMTNKGKGKRHNCRFIFAAWVGRPLLCYRRAIDVYLRLCRLFQLDVSAVAAGEAERGGAGSSLEIGSAIYRAVMDWLDKKGPNYVKCLKEFGLELRLDNYQLRALHRKYKKRQKHPELKGKFGEDEDEDLLYRNMLIHHTLDVRKLPQKGTSLELTGTSREYRRSNSALRFRWENTIWPVLAKYMEGEDYDTQHHVKHRLLELLLSPEGGERYLPSYADHVLATPKMDYARIQREHFPLETPTSLRGCFNACLRMAREPTQEEYKEEAENAKCFLDRLRLAWEILESSSRATKREGNKVAEGVIGAYERARGRAEQELKKKSKAKDRMVH